MENKQEIRKEGKHLAVEIGHTNVGRGVFARRRFRDRQLIGQVEGKVIVGADCDPEYCVDLGEDYSLDPAPPFRFLNHSCEPNCEFVWIEPEQEGAAPTSVVVEAIREIEPGEQLTIDYAWPAEHAIRCACGSPSCRGWIVEQYDLAKINE